METILYTILGSGLATLGMIYMSKTAVKTFIENVVKKDFEESLEDYKGEVLKEVAKEIEPLKAILSRENISFQIYNTEYVRIKFERVNDLHATIYELYNFCLGVVVNMGDEWQKYGEIRKYIDKVRHSLNFAGLYLDEELKNKILSLLNVFHEFANAYVFVNADREQVRDRDQTPEQLSAARSEYRSSLTRFQTMRGQLHNTLNEIENEIRKHIVK